MEKYDYRESVLEDVREYITNHYSREELEALVNKLSEVKGQFFVVKKKELNSEVDFDNLEYFENLCNAISMALNYESSGWVVIDDKKKIYWDETLISSSTVERWLMASEEELNMWKDGICGIGAYL